MLDAESIFRLYANVMHNDIVVNDVSVSEIRAGIQCMANVYMKESDFSSIVLRFPNYNDIACRCAYLHKYAPLHTFIVTNVMLKVLQDEFHLFRNLVENANCFNVCSLGGGPGSDVIGLFSALNFVFSSFNASVTIIDCMENWCLTFKSVLEELKFGGYGTEWHKLAKQMKWNYVGANLLTDVTDEVSKPIASASFITMVKFVSASTCSNTEDMVDKIFRVMKPGALVLFIDNAAGGFSQIIERSGKRNGLVAIFGPLRHVDYESAALKIDRFGYTSCFKTKVTVILMQKLLNHRQNTGNLNSLPNITGQNVTFAITPDVRSNRGKIDNTINPRPSEVAKKSSSAGIPTVSSVKVDQNRSGINNKSMSSPVRPSVVSNLTGLSAKGITGQNATFTISPDKLDTVRSNRGKIENTTIPHPLEETNEPPVVRMPQKPVSSLTVGQNRSGISNENKSSPVRPSVFSNVTDYSASVESCMQPSATTAAQKKSIVPNSTNPEIKFSNVNQFQTPQLDSLDYYSVSINNSEVPFEQRRPIAVVPPESPTKNRYPAGNRSLQPKSRPSPTVRTYQPVEGGQNRRDERLIEVDDSPEEICCSCCSIS